MTKSVMKKSEIIMKKSEDITLKDSYDVISVTPLLLRHQKRHQTNVIRFYIVGPSPIKISDYASDTHPYLFCYYLS